MDERQFNIVNFVVFSQYREYLEICAATVSLLFPTIVRYISKSKPLSGQHVDEPLQDFVSRHYRGFVISNHC